MGEWKRCDLGELIDDGEADLQTGPFGTMLNASEYVPFGTPVIAVQDIGNNKLTHEKFVYVTPETASRLSRYSVKAGDIIFGRKGAVDRRAIIKPAEEGWLQGSDCIRLRLTTAIDARFVSYQFGSDYYKEWMFQNSGGATMPSLNQTILKHLPLTLPPLAEQKAIAAVLSGLDEKIDLLHRQNKTLEALAETLFRQWFVEEAQEEWAEAPLDEIADFLNGLACQKYPPKNEIDKLPVLKIRELKSGISEFSDWATSEIKEEYIVRSGDIVFSWSGSLLVKIWDGMDSVLNQHLFKVSSVQYPKWFVYQWTNFHLAKFIEIAESKATTMGHIKRGDLSTSMVLVPDKELIHHMDATMGPLLDKYILNNSQIAKLCKLRDTLLPKLMSGEVRVGY